MPSIIAIRIGVPDGAFCACALAAGHAAIAAIAPIASVIAAAAALVDFVFISASHLSIEARIIGRRAAHEQANTRLAERTT
jgi:hypothetical protein